MGRLTLLNGKCVIIFEHEEDIDSFISTFKIETLKRDGNVLEYRSKIKL